MICDKLRKQMQASENQHNGSNVPSVRRRRPVMDEERMRPDHWLGSVPCASFSDLTWTGDGNDKWPVKTISATNSQTRHRASTSMHSLRFCIRIMLPERHHWKPSVMLRTPPVDGHSPASQPCPLPVYEAQF